METEKNTIYASELFNELCFYIVQYLHKYIKDFSQKDQYGIPHNKTMRQRQVRRTQNLQLQVLANLLRIKINAVPKSSRALQLDVLYKKELRAFFAKVVAG